MRAEDSNFPEQNKSTLPFYQRKEFIPLTVFAAILFFLFLATTLSGPPPVIHQVFQEDKFSCQLLTIEGANFGQATDNGRVRIGDHILAVMNYLAWNNEKIIVVVPREIPSGAIYVITKNGTSLGDIYLNPDELPRLASFSGPLIKSIEPGTISPGRVLTIKGERFGQERGQGYVSFPSLTADTLNLHEQTEGSKFIKASDWEYEYLVWTDTEIKVRVPDSAKTGMVTVSTTQGQSNAKYLSIMRTCGRKEYTDKASYTLRYTLNISSNGLNPGEPIFFHIPLPLSLPEQRRLQYKNLPSSQLELGLPHILSLKIEKPAQSQVSQISFELSIDCYAIKVEVEPSLVEDYCEPTEEFYREFTADDNLCKASHPLLNQLFFSLVGNEKNQFLIARKVYEGIINSFNPQPGPAQEGLSYRLDWQNLFTTMKADAYGYANLFVSLVRKAGLPARLVSGWYITPQLQLLPHTWAEFYLRDLGWVPVDPYLEDKTTAPIPQTDVKLNYFGYLDNRHLAVSKAWTNLPKLSTTGQIKTQTHLPGLQDFYEEGPAGSYASMLLVELLGTHKN